MCIISACKLLTYALVTMKSDQKFLNFSELRFVVAVSEASQYAVTYQLTVEHSARSRGKCSEVHLELQHHSLHAMHTYT